MKNGTPIKGKKGWVHFGAGQLSEFEYIKYLTEQDKSLIEIIPSGFIKYFFQFNYKIVNNMKLSFL